MRDEPGAIPNFKAIERAFALTEQHTGPCDRALIREPKWQHLDACNAPIA
jgi:hypothetical protein